MSNTPGDADCYARSMVHWQPSFPSREIEKLAFAALGGHLPEIGRLPAEHNEGKAGNPGLPGAPDFVTRMGDRRIGVEVTELVRDAGQNIKATPAMQHQVATEAQRLAAHRGHPPMSVSLYFRGAVSKPRVRPLAECLVQLVEEHMPSEGINARLADQHWKRFPPEVTNVLIHRHGLFDRPRWQSPQAWWVDQNAPPAIQRVIDAKGAKVSAYLAHCDACWLLLWVQLGSAAGAFEINASALEATYTAPFERVFLWDAWREQVHELRISSAG